MDQCKLQFVLKPEGQQRQMIQDHGGHIRLTSGVLKTARVRVQDIKVILVAAMFHILDTSFVTITIIKCSFVSAINVFFITIVIIIITKKYRQYKAGREQFTPYQSKDPSHRIPTYRKNEKGGKE